MKILKLITIFLILQTLAVAETKTLPGYLDLSEKSIDHTQIIVRIAPEVLSTKNFLNDDSTNAKTINSALNLDQFVNSIDTVTPLIATEQRLSIRSTPKSEDELSRFFVVNLKQENDSSAIFSFLESQPQTELVYYAFQPMPSPGKSDIKPKTPNFTSLQHFRDPAPIGMDVKYSNSQPGGQGKDVTIADIEYSWHVKHEDLPLSASSLIAGPLKPDYFAKEVSHGTAVIGLLAGIKNNYGILGIANQAHILLAEPYNSSKRYNIPTAIAAAIKRTKPGDVILLEQQLLGPKTATCHCGDTFKCDYYVPVEYDPATFAAIKQATKLGRIVVEAAGNGGVELDSPVFGDLFNSSVKNSGAILVAAATSNLLEGEHRGYCFSNGGSRIDLNSWGYNVVTSGYGDLFPPKKLPTNLKEQQEYTAVFGGTSSASALIAGTAASFQGYAKEHGGALTNSSLKDYLFLTGTAPSNSSRYGIMPDLKAAILKLNNDRGI